MEMGALTLYACHFIICILILIAVMMIWLWVLQFMLNQIDLRLEEYLFSTITKLTFMHCSYNAFDAFVL